MNLGNAKLIANRSKLCVCAPRQVSHCTAITMDAGSRDPITRWDKADVDGFCPAGRNGEPVVVVACGHVLPHAGRAVRVCVCLRQVTRRSSLGTTWLYSAEQKGRCEPTRWPCSASVRASGGSSVVVAQFLRRAAVRSHACSGATWVCMLWLAPF